MTEDEKDTLVAFLDISGFKSYLNRGDGRDVLNDFYNIGANILRDYNNQPVSNDAEIKGILVSDCAILYMSEENGISLNNWPDQLLSMMYVIKKYNLEMLNKNHLLTTSIACGPCDYEPRIDNLYTRKNPLIGNIVCAKIRLVNPEEKKVFTIRLKQYCKERIQNFKIPVKIEIVNENLYGNRIKKKRYNS